MTSTSSVTITRLDSLTGLRIFAALLVFGRHVSSMGALERGPEQTNFLAAGMVGVSFFYVLSGFVLVWTAREGDTPGQFYRRRFARIYPLYFVCWGFALVVLLLRGEQLGWPDFFALTLLQSWSPDESIYFAASVVFWSLSCEAFFYLAFPFAFPKLRDLTERARLMLAVVLVGVVLGAAAIANAVDTATGDWLIYIFPPTRFLEFVLGILIALQLRHGRWQPRVPLWAAIALVVVAYLGAAFTPESFTQVAVTLIPFVVIVWAAAQADLAGSWSPFRAQAIVTLGVWSYALYLIHNQVIRFAYVGLEQVAGVDMEAVGGLPLLGIIMMMLAVSVAAAGILHKVVEAPGERWLRPKRREVMSKASPGGPAGPGA